MPIEFARISKDKRVTLVLYEGAAEVQTYWALSACEDVESARHNLCGRENTIIDHIDSISRQVPVSEAAGFRRTVREWMETVDGVNAAIWTALESNWTKKRGENFSIADAKRYLHELASAKVTADAYRLATEYIRNTPSQVRTALRVALENGEDFTPSTLPAILFE